MTLNTSLLLSPGPGKYLGRVWTAHLNSETLPSGFAQGLAPLASDALLCLAPELPAAQNAGSGLGMQPGLVLGLSQGQVFQEDESGEAHSQGGRRGPRLQSGSSFICKANPSAPLPGAPPPSPPPGRGVGGEEFVGGVISALDVYIPLLHPGVARHRHLAGITVSAPGGCSRGGQC